MRCDWPAVGFVCFISHLPCCTSWFPLLYTCVVSIIFFFRGCYPMITTHILPWLMEAACLNIEFDLIWLRFYCQNCMSEATLVRVLIASFYTHTHTPLSSLNSFKVAVILYYFNRVNGRLAYSYIMHRRCSSSALD